VSLQLDVIALQFQHKKAKKEIALCDMTDDARWLAVVAAEWWLDARALVAAAGVCRGWREALLATDAAWLKACFEAGWAKPGVAPSTAYERFMHLAALTHAVRSPQTVPSERVAKTGSSALCVVLCGGVAIVGCSTGDIVAVGPQWQQSVHGHDAAVTSMAFDKHSRWLVTGGSDGTVCGWRLPALRSGDCDLLHAANMVLMTEQHSGSVRAVLVRDCSAYTAAKDHTIRRWDLAAGRCTAVFEGHHGVVHSIALCESKGLLVSGASDSRVIVWDVHNPARRAVLRGHAGWVTAVACDDDIVVSASAGDVRAWPMPAHTDLTELVKGGDSAFRPLRREFTQLIGHRGMINSLEFNGRHIVSGGNDGVVCVWERLGRECKFVLRHTLQGHADWVNVLAIHRNVPVVASGDATGRVMLWDYHRGVLLRVLQDDTSSAILGITFSRRRLAFVNWHGRVKLLDFAASSASILPPPPPPLTTTTSTTMTTEERMRQFPNSALLRLKNHRQFQHQQ